MDDRVTIYLIILMLIFSLWPKVSYAQQIPFIPRDNIIFATLNQLQAREDAIIDAMKEAQMQVLESQFVTRKKGIIEGIGFSLKDLASHAHPYLTQVTTLDDNVDNAQQRKSSVINTITPGIKMNFQGRGKSLILDMFIDNTYYNNRKRNNSQSLELDLLYNFSIGRFTLSVANDYYDNYLATEEFGIEEDQFVNYRKNTLNTLLARSFNRFGFDTSYNRVDYWYEEGSRQGNDRVVETYSFNQYLRVATRTRILFEYKHGRARYRPNPSSVMDYNNNDYALTITGVLSPKITGSAKIGYKLQDPKAQDNYKDTTLTGDLGYKVSDRTDLALTFKRVIHEPTTQANYYVENDFRLTGNHRFAFNPKFRLSYNYEADYFDYSKKTAFDEETRIYTWGLGLTYNFRQWLDFDLSYTDKKVVSNKNNTEYDKITVTFKTQARF